MEKPVRSFGNTGTRCVESFSPGCSPRLHCEDLTASCSVHTHTGGAAITYRKSPQKTSLRATFQRTTIRSHNCAKGFLESLSGCFCCGWWHFTTLRIIFHSLSFCDLNTQRQIDVGKELRNLLLFWEIDSFFFFRFGISNMRHKQINKQKCTVIAVQFKTNNEAAICDEKIIHTRGAHMPQIIQHSSNYAVN